MRNLRSHTKKALLFFSFYKYVDKKSKLFKKLSKTREMEYQIKGLVSKAW